MSSILKWIVGVRAVWFAVTLGLMAYLTWVHASSQGAPAGATSVGEQVVTGVLAHVLDWGTQLGHFIAPIVQIALIIMIMIAAAERFGFTAEKRLWSGFAALGAENNVQAFIAVAIIGGLVLGMFGGLLGSDAIKDLKDLALVVVGVYFGTRRRQGEVEEAVAAGIATATQQRPPGPAAATDQASAARPSPPS
jgi:hypothetical protein